MVALAVEPGTTPAVSQTILVATEQPDRETTPEIRSIPACLEVRVAAVPVLHQRL
jgi:hypothetical protein